MNEHNFKVDKKTNIQWQSQNCDSNSILFYNLKDSTLAQKQFENHLANSKYKYCLVPTEYNGALENIINVGEEFGSLQYSLSEQIYPIKNLKAKYVGVTGTNGKTTTVHFLSQMLNQKSKTVLTLGTLGVLKNGSLICEFGLTTPAYIDLHKFIYTHGQDVEFICLEISSHALEQRRFGPLKLDSAIFTSFSQDHLDYHKTMKNYFESKMKILGLLGPKACLLYPIELKEMFLPYKGRQVKEVKDTQVNSTNNVLSARYNQVNISLAIASLSELGIEIHKTNLDKIKNVPGRYNIFNNGDGFVIIDFAHTPDAVINLLESVSVSYPNKKLISIIGCGGDRDRMKRPLMAKAAQKYSDIVIVTSDNPRTEDPKDIINDMISGLSNEKESHIIMDRKQAIKTSLKMYGSEVIVIAGKGHEAYLDICGKKIPYSDEEEVLRNIK